MDFGSVTSNCYVYEHRRVTDGSVFYVGKGAKRRAYVCYGRSRDWNSITAIDGRYVRIVADNLDEELAFFVEMELIAKYRAIGINLCNKKDGGKGGKGASASDETRLKMSKSASSRIRKPFSDAVKKKMSDARIGYRLSESAKEKLSHINKGKKHDASTIEKIRASNTGKKRTPESRARMVQAWEVRRLCK